ncbi:hypothetical protein LDL08_13795 [Nonomuraea glycinis]|uniref:Uncharacterized protein n=1 Tax=Nonomuraea glycinis TaxID=2047744 RepID=A0A918E5H4_9ACTN|nr:hypothetical protein [Nonomuraea glycinis]MCA2177256.1 hypothetical protein [Nonomuraea glycinis]GGP08951.1 hypothetical protein GCM10012278_42600 [Nonomuraea glycinis]
MTRSLLLVSLAAGALTVPLPASSAAAEPAIRQINVRPAAPVVGAGNSVRLVIDVVAKGVRGQDGVSIKVEPGAPPGPDQRPSAPPPSDDSDDQRPSDDSDDRRPSDESDERRPSDTGDDTWSRTGEPPVQESWDEWSDEPSSENAEGWSESDDSPAATNDESRKEPSSRQRAEPPAKIRPNAKSPAGAGTRPDAESPTGAEIRPDAESPAEAEIRPDAESPAESEIRPDAESPVGERSAEGEIPAAESAKKEASSAEAAPPAWSLAPDSMRMRGGWQTWRFLPDKPLNRYYPAGTWTITATAKGPNGTSVTSYASFQLRRESKLSTVRVARAGDAQGVRLSGSLTRLDPRGTTDFSPFARQRVEILWREDATGAWRRVAEATTTASGAFHRTVSGRPGGDWRVRYLGTGHYAPDDSKIRQIN